METIVRDMLSTLSEVQETEHFIYAKTQSTKWKSYCFTRNKRSRDMYHQVFHFTNPLHREIFLRSWQI
jgi:hypothetical protein